MGKIRIQRMAALFYRNAAARIDPYGAGESQRLASEETMLKRPQTPFDVGPEFSQNI
jgi:hypothetical protein